MAAYRGILYRAVSALWQDDPLSGEGARLHGGRFNRSGVACLYTALTPETALREVSQGIGTLQPTLLVALAADFSVIADMSSSQRVERAGYSWDAFSAQDWRAEVLSSGSSGSQQIADTLIAAGYQGMKVPCFAPGAGPEDCNMVLWRWGPDLPHQLRLIDDDSVMSRISVLRT